jgi:hypothetical protein
MGNTAALGSASRDCCRVGGTRADARGVDRRGAALSHRHGSHLRRCARCRGRRTLWGSRKTVHARLRRVERHSLCTRLVTRGEDELWITPIAVIGHVRRQRDDAGGFCRTDRVRLSSGKPTRSGGALAPRSGSGAAALLKRSTESVAVLGEAGDMMLMKPSPRGWRRSSSAAMCSLGRRLRVQNERRATRRYRQEGLSGLADGRTACITTRDSWPPRSKHECHRRPTIAPRGDQC